MKSVSNTYNEVEESVITDNGTDNISELIVFNDDYNTFDWVIAALVEICEMAEMQAEQCSLIIHYKGKCAVLEGDYKSLKPKCNAITDRGIQASIEQLTAK